MTTTVTDPYDPGLELVSTAMIAKLAGSVGAPRLAVAAARRTRELADRLVVSLRPLLAATSVEAEYGPARRCSHHARPRGAVATRARRPANRG